jgi:hypothetical protein
VTDPRRTTADEATATEEALAALLEASLVLWDRRGEVRRSASGAISVRTSEHQAEITRADPGVPFRWLITIDRRRRYASSIPGLLRALRMALDESFQPGRVRIAAFEVGE